MILDLLEGGEQVRNHGLAHHELPLLDSTGGLVAHSEAHPWVPLIVAIVHLLLAVMVAIQNVYGIIARGSTFDWKG